VDELLLFLWSAITIGDDDGDYIVPLAEGKGSKHTADLGSAVSFLRWGESFAFYPAVSSILHACRVRHIPLALASRTHDPDLARDMLKTLHIIPTFSDHPAADTRSVRALDYFDYLQIFPGKKTQHFSRIQQASSIPYEDMIFFDDEARNRNVQTELGVTFCLVRDGMTREEVDRGVWEWRRRMGIGAGEQKTLDQYQFQEEALG
jgi:magnesium-dependent phosphatase 1